MTDGLEVARRSEVAESFRYARAFYDEAEATGPAEFERNRQAIIDVIALAYRDGQSSARATEREKYAALAEAARAYYKAHIAAIGLTAPPWTTEEEGDASIAKWRSDMAPLVKEAAKRLNDLHDAIRAIGQSEEVKAIIDVIALTYRDGQSSARASESALRAAARAVLDHLATWNWFDMSEAAQRQTTLNQELRNALDGAPWEPNEEMVERVAIALYGRGIDHEWAQTHPWESLKAASQDWWREEARAALKAAMGIESGSAG